MFLSWRQKTVLQLKQINGKQVNRKKQGEKLPLGVFFNVCFFHRLNKFNTTYWPINVALMIPEDLRGEWKMLESFREKVL